MEKNCEDFLWRWINRYGIGKPWSRDVIDVMVKYGMINNHKQAWRTLEKWDRKGLYEWGSKMDLGWKVQKNQKPDSIKKNGETI